MTCYYEWRDIVFWFHHHHIYCLLGYSLNFCLNIFLHPHFDETFQVELYINHPKDSDKFEVVFKPNWGGGDTSVMCVHAKQGPHF